MHASPLRQLAKRYAAGNLGREDYLNQRRALLNAYSNGKTIDYRTHRPIVLVRGRRRLRPLIFSTVFFIAIISIVGAWWLSPFTGNDKPGTDAKQTTKQLTAGEQLLRELLADNDWSQRRLQVFKENWGNLSNFERETARRSLWYRRLVAKTQKELQEIKALQAIDPNPQLGLKAENLRGLLALLKHPVKQQELLQD